jgi:hypothetical protein
LAQSFSQLLRDGREIQRLAADNVDIIAMLRQCGQMIVEFYRNVKSEVLMKIESTERPNHIMRFNRETQHSIQKLYPALEAIVDKPNVEGDLESIVEQEMAKATKAIEQASQRLQGIVAKGNLDVHASILHAAVAITTAVAHLIKCATASQQEIVAQNASGTTVTTFYKKNHKWTQGLISAAQSVSHATVYLVDKSDQLLNSKGSWEEVMVAAQEVSVATTQLVAAARVKATLYSKTQQKLEQAATAVRNATKLLVSAVEQNSKLDQQKTIDEVGAMSKHEAKVKEMEQQVKILELEKLLRDARFRLGAMRKAGYHEEE